jgi:hypothetical protein
MGNITLKKYYVEQFELTPAVIREHLVFLAADDFISNLSGLECGDCCDSMNKETIEHQTKNGSRFTVECLHCGAKSVMATTAVMAELSWFQKFSTWACLSNNPLFKNSIAGFVRNIDIRDEETQVYLLLELLAGLNIFNKIHDANKKRCDGDFSLKDKTNVDAVSMLVRSAQKSVVDKLDACGVSVKDAFTQRRLKGITDKIISERADRIALMKPEAVESISGIIEVFKECFQNDK